MEKFVTPCALPNEHERELLTILIEECAEVQQRATKLLRFGALEAQPGQDKTNAYRLGMEIGDLIEMFERCRVAHLFTTSAVQEGREHKRAQLAKYMQTEAAAAAQ